jgi:hypothetical protein
MVNVSLVSKNIAILTIALDRGALKTDMTLTTLDHNLALQEPTVITETCTYVKQ